MSVSLCFWLQDLIHTDWWYAFCLRCHRLCSGWGSAAAREQWVIGVQVMFICGYERVMRAMRCQASRK